MTNHEKLVVNIGIICVLFILLFSLTFSAFSTPSYDIAFADGETSYLITAIVEPLDSLQEVVWSLEWDEENTGSVQYWAIKDKDPLEYVGLEIDGLNCTVSFIKYYKVLFTITVYLKLTATSVENEEISAVCTIKLG